MGGIDKEELMNKRYGFPIWMGINGMMANYSSGLQVMKLKGFVR